MSTEQTASPTDTGTTPGSADDPRTTPSAEAPAGTEAAGATPGDAESSGTPSDGTASNGAESDGAESDGAAAPSATPGAAAAEVPPAGPAGLPPAGTPAQPPKPKSRVFRTVAGALGAVLVVVLIGGGKYLLRSFLDDLTEDKDHIDKVVAGDCLRETPDDRTSPYRIVGCDDAAATYKALTVVEGGTDGSCIHVAGVTRSVMNSVGNVCLGPKDVDPAKAVNVAKKGDCLHVDGDEAQRVDCSDADAQYVVLERLDDVVESELESACAKVPGAISTYSWDWESDLTGNLADSVDVVLCLGGK